MDAKWLNLTTGNYPRRGELILVKGGKTIYPHVLIVNGSLDWWWYDPEKPNCGLVSGTKLAFHGTKQWLLVGEVNLDKEIQDGMGIG